MAIGFSTALRNSRLDAITAAIDAGAGAGTLKIYTGTRPSTGGAITSQVLLGTLTFSDPSAPAASGGVLTFNSITQDASADATGTAAWARVADSTGAFVMDMSVTATGGGGDIELNTTAVTSGGPISVTSATITEGNP